jgi:secreted PhoX family phosphatase
VSSRWEHAPKDSGAEGTGIYFGKDPHTLFVNLQHTAADRDGTWAITNRD